MIQDTYELITYRRFTRFFFISEGVKGRVLKAIMFDRIGGNKWNLGFGDVIAGASLDDAVMTNNNDVARVLGTVSKATQLFSEHYPRRVIVIHPVDEKRQRLYNLVFKRRYAEISATFDVFGKKGRIKEPYSSSEIYLSFELHRKNR